MFGKKSERVDPRQLQLALEQLTNEPGPIEMDAGDTPVRGHACRRSTGRRPLPAHLPRRRVEIDVAEADKVCACGHAKTRIGEAVIEKLEYAPASFRVIATARAKYACPQCHAGVVEAPAPPQAVERALAGEGLLAHVVARSTSIASRSIVSSRSSRGSRSISHDRRRATGWRTWPRRSRRSATSCAARSRPPTTCRPTIRRSRCSTSAAAATRAACGPISIRWSAKSSSTPRGRMSGPARAVPRGLPRPVAGGRVWRLRRPVRDGTCARDRLLGARAPALHRGLHDRRDTSAADRPHPAAVRRRARGGRSAARGAPGAPAGRARAAAGADRHGARASRGSCSPSRRSATACGISRTSGRPCSASSRTAPSPSITTAPRTSCAWSPSAARIGSSRAASKAPVALRSCTRSSRAVSSLTSVLRLPQGRPRPRRDASAVADRSARAPRLGRDLRPPRRRLIPIGSAGPPPALRRRQDAVHRTLTSFPVPARKRCS
jgi:Transposase C of IS166 homeodomain/zinc-finger binding domain of transposase IS66